MKLIAVCTNIPEIDSGGFESKEVCAKYPGSQWVHELWHLAKKLDEVHVFGGDKARYLVMSGVVRPGSVYVIQEESAPNGEYLMGHGCNGALLTCFESPIFTYKFYDYVDVYKKRFRHHMLFEGGTHRVTFPSFDESEIVEPVLWSGRKFMCVVSSNKHYSMLGDIRDSRAYKEALIYNLHDKRYAYMSHFKKLGKMDVFGRGWHPSFGRELAPDAKIETIKNYKFYLCFENVAWPGYVTEKIIQCFVAGVVPIYLGAPDHKDLLPRGAYIDGSDFKTPEQLQMYLESLDTPENAHYLASMVKVGREWLKSDDGLNHSYRGFAKRVLDLINVKDHRHKQK